MPCHLNCQHLSQRNVFRPANTRDIVCCVVTVRSTVRAILAPMKYGELLKRARDGAGRGLREAARDLSMSASYLSKVESSDTDPMTGRRTIDAARYYGVDPIPLLMAMHVERTEVRLRINGDTLQARRFAAILDMRWTERDLTAAKIRAMLKILED